MKKSIWVCTLLICLVIFTCVQRSGQGVQFEEAAGEPPIDLIKSNYLLSEYVIAFNSDSISIKERIYADDGTLGYAVFEVCGTVKEVYKGKLSPKDKVKYQFWAEFEKNWEENWSGRRELILFLNRDRKTSGLKCIEFGMFDVTPGMIKMIEHVKQKIK